jgi:hypothetical protein
VSVWCVCVCVCVFTPTFWDPVGGSVWVPVDGSVWVRVSVAMISLATTHTSAVYANHLTSLMLTLVCAVELQGPGAVHLLSLVHVFRGEGPVLACLPCSACFGQHICQHARVAVHMLNSAGALCSWPDEFVCIRRECTCEWRKPVCKCVVAHVFFFSSCSRNAFGEQPRTLLSHHLQSLTPPPITHLHAHKVVFTGVDTAEKANAVKGVIASVRFAHSMIQQHLTLPCKPSSTYLVSRLLSVHQSRCAAPSPPHHRHVPHTTTECLLTAKSVLISPRSAVRCAVRRRRGVHRRRASD